MDVELQDADNTINIYDIRINSLLIIWDGQVKAELFLKDFSKDF